MLANGSGIVEDTHKIFNFTVYPKNKNPMDFLYPVENFFGVSIINGYYILNYLHAMYPN